MQGWVKLHRSLQSSAIANHPEYLAVWVHLLMRASHKPREAIVGRSVVALNSGDVVFGRKKFSAETGVSENKVRAALDVLKRLNQITIKSHAKFSVISITKWSEYQTSSPANDHDSASNAPAPSQHPATDKNVENGENGEEIDLSSGDDLLGDPDKPKGPPPTPHGQIIELYHEILPELPRVVSATWPGSVREKNLASRWKQLKAHQNLDFWAAFFEGVKRSPWHLGDNDRGWKANLGWLVERRNFDKIIERIENEGL